MPDKTQTTVSSIVAANRTGSAITFRLSVHVAGASADDKQFLFYDKSVAANDSFSIVIGITLNQADVIKVRTLGAYSKRGDNLHTIKTPAVTIVAACINAETGVGPSIASGNHVCKKS